MSASADVGRMKISDDFEVEHIYDVSAQNQGSWVALCVDGKGRLIAGDQEGDLYRVALDNGEVNSVEPIELDIGYVNGLEYAFDSLYAVVAEDKYQGGGLYRIRDLDGDDEYDSVEYLRDFVAKGEHGPHSVVLSPENEQLYVVSGNKTPVPRGDGFHSLVPEHWGEDDLLPRLWGPIGSEKGTTAPGGWIARTDSEGKRWELVAVGLRNPFDIAFNERGDLFTTDADAEFDMATAWYQPTRLLHVVAGTDYGWRSGSGKWQPYFADTLPPVHEYGPGSPTGIAFGYGTRFPKKYQRALFACDWSWGRVFVSWLVPDGASYVSETETFLSGVPLPIADLIANPIDGNMYFVLGGRGTKSGLYRIRYVGDSESLADPLSEEIANQNYRTRQELESLLLSGGPDGVANAWPSLSSPDRAIRHSARLVLEKSNPSTWGSRALNEPDPIARVTALLALARSGNPSHLPSLLSSIASLDWRSFSREQILSALRCLEVAFIRMGSNETTKEVSTDLIRVRGLLEDRFPANDVQLDAELLKLLVYLESRKATGPAIELLKMAGTQEDALRYIVPLRVQTVGWSKELRKDYFAVLGRAYGWSGGLSLTKYIERIIEEALATVPEVERVRYSQIVEDTRPSSKVQGVVRREFIKLWTMEELSGVSPKDLENRDLENGRKAFVDASCFACHRVGNEGGGMGPDLTAVMRRFSPVEVLESIVDPSKVVSDQFGLTRIRTTDGSQIVGKIVNYYGDSVGIQTDALDSANILRIPSAEIEAIEDSFVSPMPPGLISSLTRDDILDLLAYLNSVSGG